jgi:hypothetical protein
MCQNEEKKISRLVPAPSLCTSSVWMRKKKFRASCFVCALSLRASSVRVGEKKIRASRLVFAHSLRTSSVKQRKFVFRASRLLLAPSLCRRYCRSKCFFGSRFAPRVRVFVVQALSVRMVKKTYSASRLLPSPSFKFELTEKKNEQNLFALRFRLLFASVFVEREKRGLFFLLALHV